MTQMLAFAKQQICSNIKTIRRNGTGKRPRTSAMRLLKTTGPASLLAR
jgi:hypothetical protein